MTDFKKYGYEAGPVLDSNHCLTCKCKEITVKYNKPGVVYENAVTSIDGVWSKYYFDPVDLSNDDIRKSAMEKIGLL